MPTENPLIAQLGGREAIHNAVARFFESIPDDPLMSLYFDGTDLERLAARFSEQLILLISDPRADGSREAIARIHAHKDITDLAFDEFLDGLCKSMQATGEADLPIEQLRELLLEVKNDVVNGVTVPQAYVYRPQSAT